MASDEGRAKRREQAAAWRRANPAKAAAMQARGDAAFKATIRELVVRGKDRPCAACGTCYPTVVMAFHHRDPATKLFNIGNRKAYRGVEGMSMRDSVAAEIEKCDVLCSNCHLLHHAGLLEGYPRV